jgi:hypothetical protein
MVSGTRAQKRGQNRPRQNANFARRFKPIVKPKGEDVSRFPKMKSGVWSAHPATTRGAYRDRHGREVRDAVDAKAA